MDALAHDPVESAAAPAQARPPLDLELINIRKRYGDFTAVDGVSLKVSKGQFVCLLGPSGCGKTTTLRCIAGLEEPDDGDILIGGKEATRDPPWQRDIAMMFQDFALFPHMTVAKQVGFGLEMLKKPKAEIAQRVQHILKSFEIDVLADRKPASLSGGQRQRVALARAMITEPRILLLDEPIGALDYSLRETVMLELKLLQQRTGISFIWVTHDQNEAFSLGDLVVVMNHARIEQQGPPEEILQRPATAFVAGFVQGNNVFRGRVKELLAGMLRIETPVGIVPRAAAACRPAGHAGQRGFLFGARRADHRRAVGTACQSPVGGMHGGRIFRRRSPAHLRAIGWRGAEVRSVRRPCRADRAGPEDGAGLAGGGRGSACRGRRMSTIRVRSPASYWLAVPAAAWMLGVVVVPIVLLVWVSFWGGRAFSTASPLTFDNYAKFFANQTYLKLALSTIVHTATLMAVTGVLGYCIAYFLVMKVKSPGWRTVLFLAFVVPFWTSTLIRAIAWVPFLGVNGVINQTLMFVGATNSPIEAFLYSLTGITMAQVSLYTMLAAGPVVYMLNAVAPQLREAAMTLKATPFIVFRRIVFPLTLPGVVIGQVLVFLNVMSDFATVATIGGNKHALLSNLVLLFYEGSQIRAASVVAVLLMICMLIGVVVALRVVDIRRLGAER